MNINVDFTDFKDTIKRINIFISDEQRLSLSPTIRKTLKDGEEFVEKLVRVKFVDEQISYEEEMLINRKQVNDLIKVLQELKYQIKD